MSRRGALATLGELTSEQWGMVTAGQASAAGVSWVDLRRLVSDGILEPVPGAARVYRLAGSPEDPELDDVRAAWLQLGGARRWEERIADVDAVVSHRSAAHVRGLGDVIPAEHEFYVTRRRQPRRGDLRLRVRRELSAEAWELVGGLPVSRVERIVVDLLADNEDESAVASICQDAIARGLLRRESLAVLVAPHVDRYGAQSAAAMASALAGAAVTR